MTPTKRTILRDALTIGVAAGVFGLSFGVLAATGGLSLPMTLAMSVLVFAGGAQFAALGVVTAGGTAAAAVVAGLLLNARFVAFGLALAPLLQGMPRRSRPAAAHILIDETAALALAQPDRQLGRYAFWVTGAVLMVAWNAGTAAGAVAGNVLGDPAALGLDAAFPAGFLALLAPLLRGRRAMVAAALGALIAVVLTPLVPPGLNILAAVLGAAGALAVPAGREREAVPAGSSPEGGVG